MEETTADGESSLRRDTLHTMPKLNIVIVGFGSRGDLESTLEIAKVLHFHHGHRVRYVTHGKYQDIVQAAGIEFYSSGRAIPAQMIARRNLPGKELRKQIPIIQGEFLEMGERLWGACIDDPAGVPDGTSPEPFVADAIIATMMSFAHSFVAARMGIPLHLQANNPRIYSKHVPHSQMESWAASTSVFRNALSWWVKDLALLAFLSSSYDNLRIQTMGLEAFSQLWWTSQFTRLRVPCTNLWSPHLLPSPPDWGDEINTAGFVFPEEQPYDPPVDLVKYLEEGDAPVYVGFGSMTFLDRDRILEAIFSGILRTGRRIIFARGWSGVEADKFKQENIFVVDEVPHHWLFPKVSAVVIHVGAGTLSQALRAGKPIIMIPVAGDQPFWSHRVFKAGCGPQPILVKDVTSELVTARVQEAFSPEISRSVREMAEKIRQEEPGQLVFARSALRTFHQAYADAGSCDLLPERVAVWKHKSSSVKLSSVAASVLISEHVVKQDELGLIRHVEWPDLKTPGDPITGVFRWLKVYSSRVVNDLELVEASEDFSTWILRRLKLLAGLLTAPVSILHSVSYGFYNIVDYLIFKFGSVAEPQQFDSNLWARSYWNMLSLLFQVPFKEISPRKNSFASLLMSPVRSALAVVNIPIGVLAFTARLAERKYDQWVGDRPTNDAVHDARVRQGSLEMKLASDELHERVLEGWKSLGLVQVQ